MNNKKTIVFTGGGSAGHVIPNIAIIESLNDAYTIAYMGSKTGIEKSLITARGIPYYPISTGKWRRYWSWQNFLDPFKVLWGIVKSYCILQRLKPSVVFSKGGFVALPVVVAAWLRGILVIAHESDVTPGLANRLSFYFVTRMCLSFEETKKYFSNSQKCEVTGTPIRPSLYHGKAESAKRFCGFARQKSTLLIMGGGSGSCVINRVLRLLLPTLLLEFNVIHLCGQGQILPELMQEGYYQAAYAGDALPHFFALADIVISRAGANTLAELLALHKPHILIPLVRGSRGDQVHNAEYFLKKGLSRILPEKDLAADTLRQAIDDLLKNLPEIHARLQAYPIPRACHLISQLIQNTSSL